MNLKYSLHHHRALGQLLHQNLVEGIHAQDLLMNKAAFKKVANGTGCQCPQGQQVVHMEIAQNK